MTLLDLQMYELLTLEINAIIFKILNSYNSDYQKDNILKLHLNINQLVKYIESRLPDENWYLGFINRIRER